MHNHRRYRMPVDDFALARGATALGEMRFNKRAMAAVELAEGMERFHNTGALCPTRPGSGGQREHCRLA